MSRHPAENPLTTRDDVARALGNLLAPLAGRLTSGGAARVLGFNAGRHSDAFAASEAFARPLWGIAPLVAGGGRYDGLDATVRGIARGFDPSHPEYWGEPGNRDPRLAELGAVAFAIRVAPAAFVDALPPAARASLAGWIERACALEAPDNHALFHRVSARLAAEKLGAALDAAGLAADLDRIEQFDLGEGWYSDGINMQRDHHVAMALHFDALLYADFEAARDPERSRRFRERAERFARDYARWFDAEGSALPFGRGLGLRFGHAAFWGALACAGVESEHLGEVKALWLRNLRWWLRRPILDDAGLLVPGYAYPNAAIGEDADGPGSPYAGLKAFLPLALPASHPFWQVAEAEPVRATAATTQVHPRMVVCRADAGRHVFALCAGQWPAVRPRHDAAKFAKFCYSSRFGFSVSTGATGIETGAHDSMLALTDDGEHFRVRRRTYDHEMTERHAASTWEPWPDVIVRTWLFAAPPWHLRVHRIRTARALSSIEGGFAIPCEGVDRLSMSGWAGEERRARVAGPAGACEVVDLEGARKGVVVLADAGTNVMAPRTAIASLVGDVNAGELWLACAVLGSVGEAPPMPFRFSATHTGRRVEAPGFALELAR